LQEGEDLFTEGVLVVYDSLLGQQPSLAIKGENSHLSVKISMEKGASIRFEFKDLT